MHYILLAVTSAHKRDMILNPWFPTGVCIPLWVQNCKDRVPERDGYNVSFLLYAFIILEKLWLEYQNAVKYTCGEFSKGNLVNA